ncbi:DNA primase [Candidatus Pelagibacter sp.]|nr:DNA primase [Candidatus Pelagibacter sp.]
MKYPKEYLDEIKTRLKVSNVVSKYVQLKRRGKEFVGLSPFKNEKTPSFTVNDEKGFFHCFSTSEHGNIFDFLIKTQNLKFGEAVKTLALQAGMRPYTFSKADEEREKSWKEYAGIYSDYVNFFHNELLNNPDANNSLNYLKNRKLSLETINNFKIGYVRKNLNIFGNLEKKFGKKAVKECGIFYFDEKKNIYIDRFRDRIIFPINSISGLPIAIGGRITQKNSFFAKYINSPETRFFKKGNNLYNIDKARALSNKLNQIFLVEGYMDVIGLNNNGIQNCVANLGTALTEKQIKILNQFFNEIVICFDGDESGYKAAVRAAENSVRELQPEKQISFLFLPAGEDPDTFVNKNGKEKFLKYYETNKISIHEFLFENLKKQSNNSPTSLAILEKKLRYISSSIKDQFIKKYILDFFLGKISQLTPNLSKGKQFAIKHVAALRETKKIYNETIAITKEQLQEFSILYLIINNLNFFKKNSNLFNDLNFITADGINVLSKLTKIINSNDEINLDMLPIEKSILEKINKFASVKHISKNIQRDENKLEEIFFEMKKDLKNLFLNKQILELESRFLKDMDQSTLNEIIELKKLQNNN